MTARIKIEVWEVRGPWPDVVVERSEKGDVVGVIPPHLGPGFTVPSHTAEPEVLSGVWKLPSYAKKSTGVIELIRIQLKMLPEDFESVDGFKRRRWFELVIYEPGVGLFEVKGVAVMRNGNVALAEELMKVLYKQPVVLKALLIARVIRESFDSDPALVRPPIGET